MSGRIASMARFDESDAEPKTVSECAWCHGDIYAGDEVNRLDDAGGYVHDGNCADKYARERVYDAVGTIDEYGNVN